MTNWERLKASTSFYRKHGSFKSFPLGMDRCYRLLGEQQCVREFVSINKAIGIDLKQSKSSFCVSCYCNTAKLYLLHKWLHNLLHLYSVPFRPVNVGLIHQENLLNYHSLALEILLLRQRKADMTLRQLWG